MRLVKNHISTIQVLNIDKTIYNKDNNKYIQIPFRKGKKCSTEK